MRTFIVKLLIFLLVFQLLYPFWMVSFAQTEEKKCESNPPVCSATPWSLQLYLDFQTELAALLQTTPFETASAAISQWEGGIFTNKLLELEGLQNFDDSLAGQALKLSYITTSRSAVALVTTTYLFQLAALSTLADNTAGLTILLQERPIVRDWSKLLDIERNLSQTAYHLGQAGDIAKKITNTEAIQTLLKTYEQKGLLINTSSFNKTVKYMDLIAALVSLNVSLKAYLLYGVQQPLTDFKEQQLQLDPKRIELLVEDYRCARRMFGFKCNKTRKHLGKNFKQLSVSTVNQGKESWEVIKQSWKELKQALGTHPKTAKEWLTGKRRAYLTDKEKVLLRDIYGLDTSKMTDTEAWSLLSFDAQTKQQWKDITKWGERLWKKVLRPAVAGIKSLDEKEGRQRVKQRVKKATTSIEKYLVWLSSALSYHNGKLLKVIHKQFNRSPEEIAEELKVLNELPEPLNESLNIEMVRRLQFLSRARIQIEQQADISTNLTLTYKFGELSLAIKTLISTVWNKEKNLRKTLNAICSYQCSNKGTTTCYVQ